MDSALELNLRRKRWTNPIGGKGRDYNLDQLHGNSARQFLVNATFTHSGVLLSVRVFHSYVTCSTLSGRDGTGQMNTPGLNRTSRGLSYGPEQLRAWNGVILLILEEAAKFILGV